MARNVRLWGSIVRMRSVSAGPIVFAITASFAAVIPSEGAPPTFIGTPESTFAYAGDRPMRMPTEVAVTPDGRVFVADGMHDRVLIFTPDGELGGTIESAGDAPLRQPCGLFADRAGNVWIADSGNRRIVAIDSSGATIETVNPPLRSDGHAPDVTAVALSPDGALLWCIDNDGQRLLRLDRQAGIWAAFGQRGDGIGQVQYPYLMAVGANGDVFLSDVVNSRILAFDADGRAVASIGSYGVFRGALYRPKGVAVDRAGRVWISDSVTGAVQVFKPNGAFLGVLSQSDGEVLRFESPVGIAFDDDGGLYVAELAANRVRKIRIAPPRGDALPEVVTGPRAGTGQQGRNCTICHLEWIPELAERRSNLLIDPPDSTAKDPYAARAGVCLSCHDGSVIDSRRRVWEEHGHRTGVEPPETMKVPENLPLIDGTIACRTCHSAHAAGQATGDLKTAVFLRVPNQASELCMSCHTDKLRGPVAGTHPTGGMPWPVPQALIDAGARVGPNPRELTCQVCHTPHGAQNDHLLVMGVGSNQLCLNCHDQMRPGMFRAGGHMEHPLDAKPNAEQAAAIAAMGTRVGDEGQLVCLSCHKLHHGKGERYMLADELSEGQMCLRCHSDRSSIIGSSHDLRTSRPEERNRLGMTASTGGPCSSCHLFHRYARNREPTIEDRTGLCTTCHSAGNCAECKLPGNVNHVGEKCTICHNPHDPHDRPFLSAPAEQVCISCHTDLATVVGGPHDSIQNVSGWSDQANSPSDACLACHRPHGDSTNGLFRLPTSVGAPAGNGGTSRASLLFASIADPDAVCTSCHSQAAFGGVGSVAAAHPKATLEDGDESGLPLVSGDVGTAGRIGCRTCHNPHAGGSQPRLLRIAAGEGREGAASSADLCTKCHSSMAQVVLTAHAPQGMANADLESDACLPCHRAHGAADDVAASLLWSKSLLVAGQEERAAADARHEAMFTASGAALADVGDVLCVGCHRDGGVSYAPLIASHPDIPLSGDTANGPSMPLFDENGQVAAVGKITCRTCHLPHGRTTDLDAAKLATDEERRQMQLQMRVFVAPNICTGCHGDDGLRRYLYFHDPARR